MSLEDLGNIGEFIAAIAVVLSLIYLAVQIRQNTRSVRAATHHSSARALLDIQNSFAQSEELSRLFRKGAREFDKLDAEERLRFDAIARSAFVYYEDAFFQYQQSMIDVKLWQARQRSMLDHLRQPGIASWWKRASRHFSEPFVSFTEQLLQQGDEVDRP